MFDYFEENKDCRREYGENIPDNHLLPIEQPSALDEFHFNAVEVPPRDRALEGLEAEGLYD